MSRNLNFSATNQSLDNESKLVRDSLVELTRMAIDKHNRDNFLCTRYSSTENYNELDSRVKKSMLKLAAERSGLTYLNFDDPKDVARALTNEQFEWTFFDIQTQALNMVNADNEVEDALKLANISTVGLGDSKTFEIDSKASYKVQKNSYGANVSRYQHQFRSGITLTPEPYIATVDIDVVNMIVNNYDFGKQMAKLAMSFRTKMYTDIVDAVYLITAVPTAFYSAAFAKTSYVQLAQRIRSANSSGVTAFGTMAAWVSASNNVNTGYATQDEINKNGFIGNIYGVPSVILNQAVDSNSASYTFQVPDDRIILLSSAEDKPAKVVREGNIMVVPEDGRTDSLWHRTYRYHDAWKVGIASQAHYGIQAV